MPRRFRCAGRVRQSTAGGETAIRTKLPPAQHSKLWVMPAPVDGTKKIHPSLRF